MTTLILTHTYSDIFRKSLKATLNRTEHTPHTHHKQMHLITKCNDSLVNRVLLWNYPNLHSVRNLDFLTSTQGFQIRSGSVLLCMLVFMCEVVHAHVWYVLSECWQMSDASGIVEQLCLRIPVGIPSSQWHKADHISPIQAIAMSHLGGANREESKSFLQFDVSFFKEDDGQTK